LTSSLSRLESGGRRPTLELLLRLARAHEVPVDELISGPATSDPRVPPQPVTRHGRTMIPLTRRPGGLQAYKGPAAAQPPVYTGVRLSRNDAMPSSWSAEPTSATLSRLSWSVYASSSSSTDRFTLAFHAA
jgi:transcriptional regulator with XRE-family HTH domain